MQTLTRNPNAGTTAAIDAKPWYTHPWPWLLMLGPFIVVLAGVYTGWLAYSRQDALVVDDYYKQGKAINQDLRRDRAASKLGMGVDLRYDPAAGVLNGALDVSGATPQTGKLQIQLIHSTQPEKDIKLMVQADQGGKFRIALPMLEIARWQVLVEDEKRDWRLTSTWNWPAQQQIRIKADPAPAGNG